jgi:Arc/MetJ-type ribon-helix-helix transcriptional regulator
MGKLQRFTVHLLPSMLADLDALVEAGAAINRADAIRQAIQEWIAKRRKQ